MAKNTKKIIGDFTKDLLEKIGLKAEVVVKDSNEEITVQIDGENLGALIGYHGETLESLQLILNLVANRERQEGEWQRVVLDIGNWRSERLATLAEIVERCVAELMGQKLARISLPPMSPAQRRETHVIVSEKYPDLITESEGEEPNRRVVLFQGK